MRKREVEGLTETLEATVNTLYNIVEGLEDRVKKTIARSLKKLETIETKAALCMNILSKKAITLIKNENAIKEALAAQSKAFDGIEDTFFTLYHNIKKNQFLYANSPEEWWKDYLDLKAYYDKDCDGNN